MRHQRGFTLIEVMVVILIAGILASGITLVMSGKSATERLSDEVLVLQTKLQIASDYALLNNLELGLYINEKEYEFLFYEDGRWNVLLDQPVLGPYTVADEIDFNLSFDDLPLQDIPYQLQQGFIDEDNDSLSEEERERVPQVMIFPGGEITPFRANFITFDDSLQEWTVSLVTDGFNAPVIEREYQ